MSQHLRELNFNLEGDINLHSEVAFNTSGGFCDLFIGTHPTAGKLAMKRPKKGNIKDANIIRMIEVEAIVWKTLRHPYILPFLGIYEIEDEIYLVSPLAENGCLPDYLEVHPGVDRRRLVIEITEGIAYLHQSGIIHGDIKGRNILISRQGGVLICDFGLTKHTTSRTSTSLRCLGSAPWQSPELLQDESQRTFQSDVYAFGITIYEVLSGKEPYHQCKGPGAIILSVVLGERPPKEPLTGPDGTSYSQLWDEATNCWDANPARRPSIISVLNRLDRRRAETLITVQQISLECSLNATTQPDALAFSTLQNDMGPILTTSMKTGQDLYWAEKLRFRVTAFANSRRPILKLGPEILSSIILQDSSTTSFDLNHPFHYHYHFKEGFWSKRPNLLSQIYRMFRAANLRRVSTGWRDVIDSSKELCSIVWVDSDRTNAQYVAKSNPRGSIKCVVTGDPQKAVLLALEQVSHLITSMAILVPLPITAKILGRGTFPKIFHLPLYDKRLDIYEDTAPRSLRLQPNKDSINTLTLEKVFLMQLKSLAFPALRVLHIRSCASHGDFNPDLYEVLETCSNLTELLLDDLEFPREGDVGSFPRSFTHPGLRRIRINNVPYNTLRGLWESLYTEKPATLQIRWRSLLNSPWVSSALPRATHTSNEPHRLLKDKGHLITREGLRNMELIWPTRSDIPHDSVAVAFSSFLETWDFNYIQIPSFRYGREDWLNHVFSLGIRLDTVTIESGVTQGDNLWWFGFLNCLSSVRRINIARKIVLDALEHLSQPVPGTAETPSPQYLCPRLSMLEVFTRKDQPDGILGSLFQDDISSVWKQVELRQQAAISQDDPTRLQTIGVPPDLFFGRPQRDDPLYEGVEIYCTSTIST